MMTARRLPGFRPAATLASLLLLTTTLSSPVAAEPVVQQLPDTGAAQRLADSLRVLAANDTDVLALVAAGQAALDLDDPDAAYGFFARARVISARNPQVEVGLGRTLVRLERADEALAHFTDARALGADERTFAADRGLANDVRGDYPAAQADYRLALSGGGTDEVIRRLALSQAIGGNTRTALETLAPLIARGDAPSWRARAFVLAMDGDLQGARGVASARMSPGMAGLFDRFFARLPTLNPAERARAVHFGDMPAEGTRYASARPGGEQLAVATNTQPPPRTQVREQSRGRGGALIPRGEPLTRRPAQRAASSDQRTRVDRFPRPSARQLAAATLPATATATPAPTPRTTPPPPLPPAFAIQLPQPARESVVDRQDTALGASPLQPKASGGAPASITFVPGSGAIPAPLASTALPPAERPADGAVAVVDPDASFPGDTVFRPDGSSTAAMPRPSDLATSPAQLAGARLEEQPASILPPIAREESITARPGFTAPVASAVRPSAAAARPAEAKPLAVRVPVPTPAPTPKPPVVSTSKPKPAVPTKLAVAIVPKVAPKDKARPAPDAKPKEKAAVGVKTTDPKVAAKGKAKSEPKASPKAKAESKAPSVSERYWFQVATGVDAEALATDLKRLRAKHKTLGKLPGALSPFGKRRRLVVGPFDSMKEAKAFEVKAIGDGLDGYVWVSPEGFDVEPLSAS